MCYGGLPLYLTVSQFLRIQSQAQDFSKYRIKFEFFSFFAFDNLVKGEFKYHTMLSLCLR